MYVQYVFAELLARSCFSFLRGASHPEEVVTRSHELGLAAVALCDRDGLYGSVRAWTQAKECGQHAIVGTELSLKAADLRASDGEGAVLCLLVKDAVGYANLCKLLTLSHADLPKGQSALDVEWLAAHGDGLCAIVPAPSVPGSAAEPSDALCDVVRDVFGPERGFFAVHRHLDEHDARRLSDVVLRAERWGLPIVASARPLYHHASRKPLCDVIFCIREGTTLDRAGSALCQNAEARLRSEAEMLRLFPEQPGWVARSAEIAQALRFDLGQLRYRFPCELAPGETADGKLRRLAEEGARRRYPEGVPTAVAAQIDKELSLIERLVVAPYFLSTWEIVEIARRRRILCQGRGSAANSAVCYVLGITAVDPARSSLLFERFMSAERSEPPDIDIDFEHERREEVIQEIYARHGRDRAAMVSEIIAYRGKSALRESGKAFGLSLEQVDRLSGCITHWDSAELSDVRLREAGFDVGDARVRQSVMIARMLEGMPRHLSIHVGGFVLSAEPLHHVAPVEPARMADRSVVPWDKDDIEALGFFKVDVLGLGMLTAIRKCLASIHAEGGLRATAGEAESFDPLDVITRIPAEDPAVYAMVSQADTVGVFQIESRAQMAMLPRLRPSRFYDLVIEVAIVRPGPIQGGMVHPYLRRRNGEEKLSCPHPELWPILERTLGVPLFQEQVMQISIIGAGYSGGQADQLRRDMAAWKKSGKLLRHRQRLLEGFANKGIAREFGEALFEQIKGFGDYGFPESHAASFALLVYSSAWQKAHYPAHFTCALLNSQPMGFYSSSSLVRDAQAHGVEVRDVCVVHSEWDSTLEGDVSQRALRLGLRQVRGLAEAAATRLVDERRRRPFDGVEDVVRRAALRKGEAELLAESGAFEALLPGRRNALWKARAPRVPGLFAAHDACEPEVSLPALRPAEQLLFDYERKGLCVGDHPLRHLRPRLASQRVITNEELGRTPQGRQVAVAGLVLSRQQPGTASGVVFVTLEDETGIANLILYRHVYERFRLAARHARLMLARGHVERQVTPPRADERDLAQRAPATAVVHLVVRELERLDAPGRLRAASRDFH